MEVALIRLHNISSFPIFNYIVFLALYYCGVFILSILFFFHFPHRFTIMQQVFGIDSNGFKPHKFVDLKKKICILVAVVLVQLLILSTQHKSSLLISNYIDWKHKRRYKIFSPVGSKMYFYYSIVMCLKWLYMHVFYHMYQVALGEL